MSGNMSRCWRVKITAEDLQKANSFFLKSLAVDIHEQHQDGFAAIFQELLTKFILDANHFDCGNRWEGLMFGANEGDFGKISLIFYLFADREVGIDILRYFTSFASEVEPMMENVSAVTCWHDLVKQSNLTCPSIYYKKTYGRQHKTDFERAVPELSPCERAELGSRYRMHRFIKPNSDIIVDKITKTDGSVFQFEEVVDLVKKTPRYNWKGFKYDEKADEQKELIFEWNTANVGKYDVSHWD